MTHQLTDLIGDLYAKADLICEQRDELLAAAKAINSTPALLYPPFAEETARALDLIRAAIAKAEQTT